MDLDQVRPRESMEPTLVEVRHLVDALGSNSQARLIALRVRRPRLLPAARRLSSITTSMDGHDWPKDGIRRDLQVKDNKAPWKLHAALDSSRSWLESFMRLRDRLTYQDLHNVTNAVPMGCVLTAGQPRRARQRTLQSRSTKICSLY